MGIDWVLGPATECAADFCKGSDYCKPPNSHSTSIFMKKNKLNLSSQPHNIYVGVECHGWAGLHHRKSCYLPLSGNNPWDPIRWQAAGERREALIRTWVSVLKPCAASSLCVWTPKWALKYTPWPSPNSTLAWDSSTHQPQVPWFPQELKPCDKQEPSQTPSLASVWAIGDNLLLLWCTAGD